MSYSTIHTLAWPWIQKLIPYPYNLVIQSLEGLIRTSIDDLALHQASKRHYRAAQRAINDGLYEAAMGNLYVDYEVCIEALSKLFVNEEKWYHELCQCTTSMALACTKLDALYAQGIVKNKQFVGVSQKYKKEALDYYDKYAESFFSPYDEDKYVIVHTFQPGSMAMLPRPTNRIDKDKIKRNESIKENLAQERKALQNILKAY